jgi:hypothetical protein
LVAAFAGRALLKALGADPVVKDQKAVGRSPFE